MKARHIIIITIFVLVNGVIFASLDFGGEEEEKEAKPTFVPAVNGTVIQNGEETFKIVGYGTVSSYNSVDISCEVQGKLSQSKQHLKPGVNFRKGDVLFSVRDTEARYNLRAKKSGFINIIANLLPDLKTDFPTEFDKWNNYINSIRLNERLPQLPTWSTSKEKIFLSTRNVLTEYFSIKSLEEQLNKYTVTAPFSGVITDVYTTNFSVVNPGTKVMRVVETDNFEIPVSIPTSEVELVKLGTEVSVFNTNGQLKGSGVVIRVSEVINKNTQSVDVFIRPKAIEGESFTEGEYVEVEINESTTYKGVRIPNSAVHNNNVYTYSKTDSILRLQPVTVLNSNTNGMFVQGLKNNSTVITQEVLNYTDTTKYQVLIR
ncbi:MAG: HlyD family efflux transporter periplasmic adaptor subunit [Crocinitomix sp.]|nr:HlyD family efflux transporter periplasmic adaptor subunit [Crocinitomix sp.]